MSQRLPWVRVAARRRALRAAAGLGLGLATVLGVGQWEAAGEASPGPVKEAWAWVAQRGPAPPVGATTGMHEGQLPVAWAGSEEKVAFLELARGPVPGDELTLTLEVDEGGTNYLVEDAALLVCAVTERWDAAAPMAWDAQPDRDCEQARRGVYQPGSNDFFFDLSPLLPVLDATGWHGVVVAPAPEAGPLFQVVFRSALGGGARLDHRPQGGGDGGGGSGGSGPPAGGSDTSAPDPGLPVGGYEDATVSLPGSDAPAPVAAAPAAAAAPVMAAASQTEEAQRAASFGGFFAGIVGLAVLLVARPLLAGARGVLAAGIDTSGTEPGRRARVAHR